MKVMNVFEKAQLNRFILRKHHLTEDSKIDDVLKIVAYRSKNTIPLSF